MNRKSYVILFLATILFFANNCFAACEQGCKLEISCEFRGSKMTIYPCIPAESTVKIKTSNGGKTYSGLDLYQNEGTITVPEHFQFVAQNESDTLILKVRVIDIATNSEIYSDEAGQYGMVAASN